MERADKQRKWKAGEGKEREEMAGAWSISGWRGGSPAKRVARA